MDVFDGILLAPVGDGSDAAGNRLISAEVLRDPDDEPDTDPGITADRS